MDFVQFFNDAIRAGTPLLFATLGETITERSGKLNLGVEGMMLIGAVIGFSVGVNSASPMIALLGAVIAGGLAAAIFAFLTVTLRANQIVTGLTLTIFGTGFSNFLGKDLTNERLSEQFGTFFGKIKIPGLGDIKFIGDIFFNHDILVYAGYVIAILVGIYLYNTRKGLNLRAIGENPGAADAAGINISLYKYIHIITGGALCGIAGAYLPLVYVGTFQLSITSGRGWIAVALVIFITWNPYKSIVGAYFFGALEILGLYLQGIKDVNFAGALGRDLPVITPLLKLVDNILMFIVRIPTFIVDMFPYAATIIVLIIVSMRKSKENAAPKWLGEPYFREDR